jgi:hypothetical protein
MTPYRCPDPSHGDELSPLKANNDKVYECTSLHKYWRREKDGEILLANLITGEEFPAEPAGSEEPGGPERPRLNFMVDVPRVKGHLDFNTLSLSPAQWKVISRIDGTSNLEEIRLLSGLTPTEAEATIHELTDKGLIDVRRRGGA